MNTVDSRVILITGGAQGIGRLLAERAVKENAQVILWDINAE
ncbi:MAG: SDR family NAD(P)-dependent oxidoreductase, partial [Endozoicomonas sp.]